MFHIYFRILDANSRDGCVLKFIKLQVLYLEVVKICINLKMKIATVGHPSS